MSVSLKKPRIKRDEICDTLRAEVLSGQWESNQPVREHSLAERFGISRGPIRDALLQLTQEGVLIYRQNKGVRVGSPPDKEDRDLLLKLRRDLEIHCLKKVLTNWNSEDDAHLNRLLENLKLACEKSELPKVAESDLSLHRYWVSQASKEMEIIWLSITVRMRMAYSRLTNYMEIYQEHESIVDAIHRRDLQAAQSWIKKNII